MRKRGIGLLLLLGLLATLPVFAFDFHYSRTDGYQVIGTSVGQQSSNQAFNLFDNLTDVGSSSWALYWVGELQENGTMAGNTVLPFGAMDAQGRPELALKDNRQEELEVDWDSWLPVTGKALATMPTTPPRPIFTPNVPQAWNPIEVDLDDGFGTPDAFLLSVSFEPPLETGNAMPNYRDQILNAYYPQNAAGLPGNSSSVNPNPQDRFTVRPLWTRAATGSRAAGPGLLVRDLEPVRNSLNANNPGVGVITQPPIFARVPAVYKKGGSVISETLPVVYLVVGTGENSDFATVICLSLKQPGTMDTDEMYLPDTGKYSSSTVAATLAPPNPDYFNPSNGSGGSVMWSYTVKVRGGSNLPTPVAGISFADIGDSTRSMPRLYVTTADGQIICLNARAADTQSFNSDGDARLSPDNATRADQPEEEWKYLTPINQPMLPAGAAVVDGSPTNPVFHYGMNPAVARVPLNGLFPTGNADKSRATVTNAINKHEVSEWMVFTADAYGTFRAFEAPGRSVTNASGQLTSRNPLSRWVDQAGTPPGNSFRLDPQGDPERFISAPVVYQGNTPLRNSSGSVVNGSTDIGHDDEVIFASEKGCLYYLDAIGELRVDGPTVATDGQPTGNTFFRYKFPTDDTAFSPGGSIEPRVWPRTYDNAAINQDANYFNRGQLAVALGANTNPNGSNPNLDIGDDRIYVPYMQEQGASVDLPDDNATTTTVMRPTNTRWFYEYVGSIKPYGFVQTSRPILQLTRVRFTIGATTYTMPLDRIRVGTIKSNGEPVNEIPTILAPGANAGQANPNYDPGTPAPDDTLYFTARTFYDRTTDTYVTLPIGANVEVTYDAPTSASNAAATSVTETLEFPSCYRFIDADLTDPTIDPNDPALTTVVRGRASLTEANARLEQRAFRRPDPAMMNTFTLDEEQPAQVNDTLFTSYGYRQPAMYAAGGTGAGGNLLVPSFFRGRIIAFTHRLQTIRTVLGCFDPRSVTNSAVQMTYGPPVAPYGPPGVGRDETYDPGFNANSTSTTNGSLNDFPRCTDVGHSVTMVDGWTYVIYRNGHMRAYANVGGGAAGTIGGNPPYIETLPGGENNGNLVRAPAAIPGWPNGPRGIHITTDPNNPTDTTKYVANLNNGNLDLGLLLEWGQTIYVVVDFGSEDELSSNQTVDANTDITKNTNGDDLDGQILQNEVQAQIRSSNGAVQQLPGANRGVRPSLQPDFANMAGPKRIVAVIPVFCGVPSPTNPLTPGTPLLWERQPSQNTPGPTQNDFTGEVTYDLQVTQQGVRWRWPDDTSGTGMAYNNNPNPAKEHYWEIERNSGAMRFPNTGGTTDGNPAPKTPTTAKWNWNNEWAPLVSYNNPLELGYDPFPANTNYEGVPTAANVTNNSIGQVEFVNRLDPGRKNGDVYTVDYVNGSRSGSGTPVIPTLGMALYNGNAQQILFAEHNKTSPASSTLFPELAQLRVADRSHLAAAGRPLNIRVQPATLTKMGVGALYGRNAQGGGGNNLTNLGPHGGSFEQNYNSPDDAPDGLYPSIPAARMVVTKVGTNLDLVQSPVSIPGRVLVNGAWQLPTLFKGGTATDGEKLAVQVDIPPFTADDVYTTRWRSTSPANPAAGWPGGADPRLTSNGGSRFNPFFPGNLNGEPGRAYRDRAERLSRPGNLNQPPMSAPGEDAGRGTGSFQDQLSPDYDDRLRRVVVYNDANNNGVLDLLPTYREAYRTFAVQVMVKPDLRIETQQQTLDFGAFWHGKKQPGTGAGPLEIREWQQMNAMLASANPVDRSVGQYYRQYWRPFTLINTGNVNLAYVKPEIAYKVGNSAPALIGLPSEGNDPWRALTFLAGLSPVGGGPNPLVDPKQIFLRTSFDDQLLPDASAPYTASQRGIWLQKAPPGSAQGGAVAYAEKNATGSALRRDPTFTQAGVGTAEPRDTLMTLNLPTGAALGIYSGSIRIYNDRGVLLQEDPTSQLGFRYVSPTNNNNLQLSGLLERSGAAADFGEPLEPAIDPPIRLKAKIVEDMIHGRVASLANTTEDQDRRIMPAAVPDVSSLQAPGKVTRMLLAYVSNRNGMVANQPNTYDVFGTNLQIDATRGLFPFDELWRDRPPWSDLPNSAFGWTGLTASTPGTAASRPSLAQDPGGVGVLAWTERTSMGQGDDLYRIRYQSMTSTVPNPINLQPGGQPADSKNPRTGVRMLYQPAATGGPATTNWFSMWVTGQGQRRNVVFSWVPEANLATGTAWTLEYPLPTSKGLTAVNDPYVIATDPLARIAPLTPPPGQPAFLAPENTTLPQMVWMAYTGTHPSLGRSDVYLARYRTNSMLAAGARNAQNPLSKIEDYGQVPFPLVEGDVLKPNPERTRYVANGTDLLAYSYSPVQIFLGRQEVPGTQAGSLAQPIRLIDLNQQGTETTNQELVFPIAQNIRTAAPSLKDVKIIVNRAAGMIRFTMDTRTIANAMTAGGIISGPAFGVNSADPVITATYTAAGYRITSSDVSGYDPVIVPVMNTYDASWYRQVITPNAWNQGIPVAGKADRLWVFWRRVGGANNAGPTAYYKVLRPGVRVSRGAIHDVTQFSVSVGGNTSVPEEVNLQNGQIYFSADYEGQPVTVSYKDGSGNTITNEPHVVTWLDESGERPIPMDTSVNEGSLDAFASYEDVQMAAPGSTTLGNYRHMERIWMFWSSTRSSGADLFYATLAPRIGPDVNVNGSVTLFAAASPSVRLQGYSPNRVREFLASAAAWEKRRPFTLPPISRRGPYVPVRTNRRPTANR